MGGPDYDLGIELKKFKRKFYDYKFANKPRVKKSTQKTKLEITESIKVKRWKLSPEELNELGRDIDDY